MGLDCTGEVTCRLPFIFEQVNDMQAALTAADKTAEFHIYPGAPHGFAADYRSSYPKEAAAHRTFVKRNFRID
jgi:dienelactone hydrolase